MNKTMQLQQQQQLPRRDLLEDTPLSGLPPAESASPLHHRPHTQDQQQRTSGLAAAGIDDLHATITTTSASPHTTQKIAQDERILSPLCDNKDPQIHFYGLALVFLAPALGGFLYGYDIGASSFVLSMMKNDGDHNHWWHQFPKYQQGLFISSLALGALIGSHIVLVFLAHSIGRRKELRIAATLYIVGTMLNVMSGTVLSNSGVNQYGFGWGITSLIAGRLLYGAGVGFIMHGAPTYMAEMSPSQVRGALVSAKETVIVFGIIIGMLLGDFQSDDPDNWHELYAYSVFFAVPMLLLTLKIPRSKRWLLMKGYHEEAKESMQFVYRGNVEDEFEKMADTFNSLCCRSIPDQQASSDSESVCDSLGNDRNVRSNNDGGGVDGDVTEDKETSRSLCSWRHRHVMVIGMGLLIAQQFSGQPCVLAYSRVLFESAGWGGNTSVITVTIMGIVSFFTVMMVDRLGRKTLLAAGSTIMLISVSALAYGFWGWNDESADTLGATKMNIVLVSMLVFISGYQVGFGPITWTLLSEIYPTEIRGSAMALSVEVNFFSKFLTQFLFPIVQDVLGWGSTFVVFGTIILLGLLFILLKVPETKGMSLEEIQMQLKGEKRGDHSKDAADFQYENMVSCDTDTTKCLANTLLKWPREEVSTELPPIV
jgi:MFS family permease